MKLLPTTPPLIKEAEAKALLAKVEKTLIEPEPPRLLFKSSAPKIKARMLKQLEQRRREIRHDLKEIRAQERLKFQQQQARARQKWERERKAQADERNALLAKLYEAYGQGANFLLDGEPMRIWRDENGRFYLRRLGLRPDSKARQGSAEHKTKTGLG